MLLHRCMHCLAANACELKFDKKGRPYTRCRFCWAKTFMQSLESLRGVAVVPQLVELALQQRASDPDFARKFDEKIAGIVNYVRNNARPAPGNEQAPVLDGSPVVPFDEAKVGT